jgi:hypothetical protein
MLHRIESVWVSWVCDQQCWMDISSPWCSYYTQCKLGTEIPHVHVWHVHYCPRVNSFYAIRKTKLYPSSFMERITKSTVYMDMLQYLLSPPINKDETEEQTTTQQDDRPRFHAKVLEFTDSSLPCQGKQWCSWVRHYISRQNTSGLISRGSLRFFSDIILQATLWPWGKLSLLQKWIPGMSPGR